MLNSPLIIRYYSNYTAAECPSFNFVLRNMDVILSHWNNPDPAACPPPSPSGVDLLYVGDAEKKLDWKRKKWRWSMAHEGERMIEVVCGLGWGPPFKVKLIHWPLQDEVQANIHLALRRVLEAYSQ